jgi:hypothetical protein
LKEHFENAPSNTLAIFDIDMVLIQPQDPAFQMANMKRYRDSAKKILKTLPREKLDIFLNLMVINSDSVLIDPSTPPLLHSLHQKGIRSIGLTAGLTGPFGSIESMELWKINRLRSFNIDFSLYAPINQRLLFTTLPPNRNNHPLYTHGIIFANGTSTPKGDALTHFLHHAHLSPSHIIFLDDRQENLDHVEEAMKNLLIPFTGIHYEAAKDYPSALITQADFESRWESLVLQAIQIN